MRISLITFFLYISLSLPGATYYVATDGKNSNPGTITQPFATWDYALNRALAGDIVYIRGGVYLPVTKSYKGSYYGVRVTDRNGTSDKPIKIWAYPGETPVLDCSGISGDGKNYGISIEYCSYWHFKGLTVLNLKEYNSGGYYPYPAAGFTISDCSNITAEQCVVSGCGNGFTLEGSNDYIYYTNCDSYKNADHHDNGGLANGFNINIRPGSHVFYNGCRAWLNSDDGYDAFGGDGYIFFKNCWAFENGKWDGETGNGAGFKTGKSSGSKESGIQRSLINCVAWDNLGIGFDESQDDDGTSIQHIIYNCTSYHNATGYNFGYTTNTTDIIKNNISYNELLGRFSTNSVTTNSWQVATVSSADFATLNSEGVKGARGVDGVLPVLNFLHLVTGSDLIDKGTDVGLPYSGKTPDIGAFEFQTGSPPPTPLYISSVVKNTTPAIIEIGYDLILANIVPSTSAFKVEVNSSTRTINSVSISGKNVMLTLSSPIYKGDVVTVSYTKPSTKPLQTASGGQAASLSTKSVVNNVTTAYPAVPVYVSSVIKNATPNSLEITFNINSAQVVSASAAFSVKVNSITRTINTVSITGPTVFLTLSSPVYNGDVVTVSYTKPSTKPLQSSSGGLAESISVKSVVNNVTTANPAIPVYVSSVIKNATSNLLEINFNMNLAPLVSASAAFSVKVNSITRTVNSIWITGPTVFLTLASPVVYSDVVTFTYTKPSLNPLQSATGFQVASINNKTVTNNCIDPNKPNEPPVVVINYETDFFSGFIGELDASPTYDPENGNLTYTWIVPDNVSVSSTTTSKIEFLSPIVLASESIEFKLGVSDGTSVTSEIIRINIMPYKPELDMAIITNINASEYQALDYPKNASDGYFETKWSVNGDNQWLILKLDGTYKISHLNIAFLKGQKYTSYFDILGSKDNVTWEPILINAKSCSFSGDAQIFNFPEQKKDIEYAYLKLIGHGNSLNSLNNISELKVFWLDRENPIPEDPEKNHFIIYPNPASDYINISIKDPLIEPDMIRLIDLSGRIVFEDPFISGINIVQIPAYLKAGIYIVELKAGNLILYSQNLIVRK